MTVLLLVVATLAANDAPPLTRIEIRGPEKVVDGWVRTNNASSFADSELAVHGRAWSVYDTVLVRFSLAAVNPARFGRVKKATLRLQALTVDNRKKRPFTVAPSSIRWTEKATASSPVGDKTTTWPVRAAHPNINYAMRSELATERAITKPGIVDVDVTEVVESWLYQGLPNYGFIVTASPPIFGKPNAGSWTLAFAASEAKNGRGPALILEMEGAPPSPETAHKRALALYPSASLPPVRDPYYFVFYSAGPRKQWKRLATINLTTYSSHAGWLEPRGVMNLVWAEGGPVGWLPSAAAYARYYTRTAQSHTVGFCGHESNLGEKLPWLADAFRTAKASHPEKFSAYYYRGEPLMAKAAGERHIDLLIQEGYTSVHKQFPLKGFAIGMAGIKSRIDTARRHGAIQRQVVMLGHICKPDQYHVGHELTPDKIDGLIAELRKYAPEMPGIGFYGAGGDELAVACDRLARKHFVDPAPELLIRKPRFEEILTTPHVLIEAHAEAKPGRKVTRYRWFVDNRLVAETRRSRYLWDARGERVGRHVLTVHAVDDAWNRTASQIPVRVERQPARKMSRKAAQRGG